MLAETQVFGQSVPNCHFPSGRPLGKDGLSKSLPTEESNGLLCRSGNTSTPQSSPEPTEGSIGDINYAPLAWKDLHIALCAGQSAFWHGLPQ
jgi:hypothetical protein